MEFVQPIREKKKIDSIKKALKSGFTVLKNTPSSDELRPIQREGNLRDYALFTLGINSGLRISDLLELKVHDVLDKKNKVVDRIALREKKTGKTKDFPLGKTTKKALDEYLASWEHKPEDHLFPSRKKCGKYDGRLTRQQAYNIINDAARAVGIKEKIGTHTMRKTFGYHAYQQGMDITRIQQLLNHSAPSVTLRYIGITQDQLDEVYLTLEL